MTRVRPEIRAYNRMNADSRWCPVCRRWIECQRGRIRLDTHIEREHPAAWARQQAVKAELLGDTP